MSKHGLRQQKQLAKKKAKRAEKRTIMARQSSNDPTIRLAGAESWPLFASLVPENLWEDGIGQVLIVRNVPNGSLAVGVFLVDTYCLGVKNAYWKIVSKAEYSELLRKTEQVGQLRHVTSEYIAKLVRDAVEYAHALGFAPHPDYRHAGLLLAGIDPGLCSETFTFGKDGKPFYVRGPHESLEKAREIANRIHDRGGHFLIPLEESQATALKFDELEMMPSPSREQLPESD